MFTKTSTTTLTALAVAATLTACGGGGGGDSASTTPASPTNVTSTGVVSAFGSVIVNGVRYNTDNAQIVSDDGTVIDDNPSLDDLRERVGLGRVVRVRGSRTDDSNGTANSVRVDNELVGTVESVNDADGSFVVLGQTVAVTPNTVIDDSIIEAFRNTEIPNDLRFSDLAPGEDLSDLLPAGLAVEISGFPSANGFEATRVEDVNDDATGGVNGLPAGREAEVKGFVRNLDSAAGTFTINGLTVVFDDTDLDDEDFNGRELANDDFVEVKGDINTNAASPTLVASEIELEDDFRDDDFNEGEFEIEGVISEIRPDVEGTGGAIVINGFEIRVNDVSQFSVGLRVEIKGVLQDDGSIVVTRVQDEVEDTVRTEDLVAGFETDDQGNRVAITTRLGLVITPTGRTRLEDDTAEDDEQDDDLSVTEFLGRAQMNDRLEARGFPLNGTLAWTRIEIEDDDDADCRLRGPVEGDSISEPTFVIRGITVDTTNLGFGGFEDENDLDIGRTEFFSRLAAGDIVQATSDDLGAGCQLGQLTADEVEFERVNNVGVGVGGGDDNGGDDNGNDDNGGIVGGEDISGTVSGLDADGDTGTFIVAGTTVTVTADTLVDASLVEAFRGVELGDVDLVLGNIDETLADLVSNGLSVTVRVDASGNALLIEDNN
mgnify:CR=1 FL=1